MTSNLADQFISLWNLASEAPDVVSFLAKHQQTSIEQKVSVLLVDQAQRWRIAAPIAVERYLELFPELSSDDKALLELVIGEYRVRAAFDEGVSPEEFAARFPRVADSIRNRLLGLSAQTQNVDGDNASALFRTTASFPDLKSLCRLGRYRPVRLLGEGGFGSVWLAYDDELDRPIAVKIPTSARFRSATETEAYLSEARAVAALDHPNIVPVYDIGRTAEGAVYIVSKYIEGHDLAAWAQERQPSVAESAEIVAVIAQALHHAHQRHLIHRDVKPSNILIEETSKQPYLADFGLAIREEDYLRQRGMAGTPSYMSPEQASGEGHRLSGTSDLFSLGTVFYKLLTGKNPFAASTRDQTRWNVIFAEPLPPAQLNEQVPRELQRICLKALSKRASDRYATGLEFADDLRHWLARPDEASARDVAIVPKGLRSFDEEDADFFIDLIPGPRSRDGVPESVRFWLTRIHETRPHKTFAIGLLCGPSGCGKSSLMKAGVLSHVSADIRHVYVEATHSHTEARLLAGLRGQFPDLPADQGLVESVAHLRRTTKQKLVVVIDQFEQWLHVRRNELNAELVQALRHCDGSHVQAICLVRDEFAMAAARFMGELDIPIVQGHNFATADLFSVEHAKRVLTKFGQAFGRIPVPLPEPPPEQAEFLDAIASGLARDGKIISVRLVLLAEMIKHKPWTLSTLQEVGGTEGIGVNFLEDTLGSRAANPKHRLHQRAAREVLRLLLPEAGSDIKGHMRSRAELLQVSGYKSKEKDFETLLEILDNELRLITPTDPADNETERDKDLDAEYYQLTHDYLVPSLREWLTRKQKETSRGRAELRLEELAALWESKPETRHLPSLWEWARIRLLTDKNKWTATQRRMMRATRRVRGTIWMLAMGVITAAVIALQMYIAARRSENDSTQAQLLVDALFAAPAEAVPYAIRNLEPLHDYAVPFLQQRYNHEPEPLGRLRAAVALAEFGHVQLETLLESIVFAPRRECQNIVSSLGKLPDDALRELSDRVGQAEASHQWRLKARLAIVALHLGDPAIAQDMLRARPDPIQRTILLDTFPDWHAALDDWVKAARDLDSDVFRFATCLAIGSLQPGDLSHEQAAQIGNVLQNWFRQQPDGGTHSAAGWALRQWGIAVPSLDLPRDPRSGRDWYVNSIGMTMVKIPAGRLVRQTPNPASDDDVLRDQVVHLPEPIWLSDREVSRAQFQAFVNDLNLAAEGRPQEWEGARPSRSPTPEHPVQQVSWIDAVLFCNWLSHRDELAACYSRRGSDWVLIPAADGYRLPFEAEWEYACRGGAQTPFAHGDDVLLLPRYAVVLSNQTEICGSKMPNVWGLFDCHGNVYEWCQDWYDSYGEEEMLVDPHGPDTGVRRVIRGGAFDYEPERARADYRTNNYPNYRSYTIGFRVARSCPIARRPP